ncbi:MarR family transcriptional regulator [Leuconostoc rapi]|uniref:MarR family transcriptional regulator n=1 Tax=Leuconostoc rapi TaxID=1406906 RepID=UPI00195E8953|nr:MarR family transcriptional regulator [Leuconostoc rapi]MBM7436486.1 DNA-binding MarR family transcriptional regulator [Leuconostoc rapi]
MSESDNIIQELNTFVQTYAASSEFIRTTTAQQINATQAHLLMLLQSQNATNTTLADKMKLSKPAITKAIKNLTAHGYVSASQDPVDKRSIKYKVTPAGVELAMQHEHSHQSLHQDIDATIANFTPQQQETIMTFLVQINHLKDDHS